MRLTDIAAANMNGDKLPMFVIAKSNKLRCLKHVKKYFLVTESRRKAEWIHHFLNNGSGRSMINWKKNLQSYTGC